jgi:DNA-3-methyladenine glycosylase I
MDDPIRCGWCLSSDLYKEYHDQEWGTPVYDDATLFEFLILETFQAGLSWITILNKGRISGKRLTISTIKK